MSLVGYDFDSEEEEATLLEAVTKANVTEPDQQLPHQDASHAESRNFFRNTYSKDTPESVQVIVSNECVDPRYNEIQNSDHPPNIHHVSVRTHATPLSAHSQTDKSPSRLSSAYERISSDEVESAGLGFSSGKANDNSAYGLMSNTPSPSDPARQIVEEPVVVSEDDYRYILDFPTHKLDIYLDQWKHSRGSSNTEDGYNDADESFDDTLDRSMSPEFEEFQSDQIDADMSPKRQNKLKKKQKRDLPYICEFENRVKELKVLQESSKLVDFLANMRKQDSIEPWLVKYTVDCHKTNFPPNVYNPDIIKEHLPQYEKLIENALSRRSKRSKVSTDENKSSASVNVAQSTTKLDISIPAPTTAASGPAVESIQVVSKEITGADAALPDASTAEVFQTSEQMSHTSSSPSVKTSSTETQLQDDHRVTSEPPSTTAAPRRTKWDIPISEISSRYRR